MSVLDLLRTALSPLLPSKTIGAAALLPAASFMDLLPEHLFGHGAPGVGLEWRAHSRRAATIDLAFGVSAAQLADELVVDAQTLYENLHHPHTTVPAPRRPRRLARLLAASPTFGGTRRFAATWAAASFHVNGSQRYTACSTVSSHGIKALYFEFDEAAVNAAIVRERVGTAWSGAAMSAVDAALVSPEDLGAPPVASIFLESHAPLADGHSGSGNGRDNSGHAGGIDLEALRTYSASFAHGHENSGGLLHPGLLRRLTTVDGVLREHGAWAWQIGVMHSRSPRGVPLVDAPLDAVRLCIKVHRPRAVMHGPYDAWHEPLGSLLHALLADRASETATVPLDVSSSSSSPESLALAGEPADAHAPPADEPADEPGWGERISAFKQAMERALPFHILHSWVALDVDVLAGGVDPQIALEVSLLSGRCRPYPHAPLNATWHLPPELFEAEWWHAMLDAACEGECCMPRAWAAAWSIGVSHVKLKYDLKLQRIVDVKVYLAANLLQSPARRGCTRGELLSGACFAHAFT